jgi:hypothetical protein
MDLDDQTQRRTTLSRWIWIGYWAAIFVATHRPLSPGIAAAISGFDKVGHFALYTLLTVLGGWHARSVGRELSVAWMLRWAVVYAAYGAVDELLQPYVDRTASLADWAADLAGITVGTLITALWRPPRGRREAGVRATDGNVTPD